MSQFEPGLYIILPKGVTNTPGFGVGPVILIHPPPDVPVRVLDQPLIDRWIIRKAKDNTFTVFTGRARPDDYKWVLRNGNDLYVSSVVQEPGSFRFESAGQGLWKIGLPGKDAVLTYTEDVFPPLSFKPANGSDAQLFQGIRLDRE